MPGVNQVNRLMLTTSPASTSPLSSSSGASIQEKVKLINSYARKAQSEISALATKRRERIMQQLYDTERMIEEEGALVKKAEEEQAAAVAAGQVNLEGVAFLGVEGEGLEDEWDDYDG